jgi:hypothetical protein
MAGLSDAQIAYVAGVLDALGRFRIRETPDGTRLPYLAVSCPNMPLLEYLGSLTDTVPFVTKRTYDRHRCTEHCLEPHQHVVSASGRWSLSGAKATIVLAAILPHVRLQKTEIEELLAVGLDAPKKQATPNKMVALGWPMPKEWALTT